MNLATSVPMIASIKNDSIYLRSAFDNTSINYLVEPDVTPEPIMQYFIKHLKVKGGFFESAVYAYSRDLIESMRENLRA